MSTSIHFSIHITTPHIKKWDITNIPEALSCVPFPSLPCFLTPQISFELDIVTVWTRVGLHSTWHTVFALILTAILYSTNSHSKLIGMAFSPAFCCYECTTMNILTCLWRPNTDFYWTYTWEWNYWVMGEHCVCRLVRWLVGWFFALVDNSFLKWHSNITRFPVAWHPYQHLVLHFSHAGRCVVVSSFFFFHNLEIFIY